MKTKQSMATENTYTSLYKLMIEQYRVRLEK